MTRTAKTYSIDHPRVRATDLVPFRLRDAAPPARHPAMGLLRADRDRLPRWG